MFRVFSAKILMGSKKSSKNSLRDDVSQPGISSVNGGGGIRIDLATGTKKGKMHANEDRAVVLRRFPSGEEVEKKEISPPPSPSGGQIQNRFHLSNVKYLAVFDGHGGSQCAAFMRERLHEHILLCILREGGVAKCEKFEQLRFYLPDAFKSADEEFCKMYPANTSGACGVVALIHDREILVAHVGDCRAILRCNSQTIPLTRDHRPSNLAEHQRVIASGGTIVDGRVCGVLSPSRSFGDTDVRAEFGDGVVISEPDMTYVTLESSSDGLAAASFSEEPSKVSSTSTASSPAPCTFLILASDGIFEDMDHEEACEIVESGLRRFSGDPARAVERLIKAASEHSQDDCTVILAVWADSNHETPTRAKSQKYLTHQQRLASTEDDFPSREEATRDEESNVHPYHEDA